MAEGYFRDQLGQFRWAQTAAAAEPASGSSGDEGFLSRMGFLSSYVPLRSNARSDETEAYLTLSRWDRLIGFFLCGAGAAACFLIAFLTLPFLAIKPRKFAVAFSLGSLLFMLAFAVLQGPVQQFKHMTSPERLPFTAAFVGSLGLTLYFALGLHSFLGTLICAIVQVVALLSYLVAYFPGGILTLRAGGRIMLNQVLPT